MNNAQKVDVDDLNVSADGDSGVVDQQFDRGLESRLTMVVDDLPLIRFGNVQPTHTFIYNIIGAQIVFMNPRQFFYLQNVTLSSEKVCLNSAVVSRPVSWLMSEMQTFAPCSKRRLANSLPMLRPEPVTKHTLSLTTNPIFSTSEDRL